MNPVSFELPFPPSVNAAWRNTAGRTLISKPYRQWKRTAAEWLMAQKRPTITGRVDVQIILVAPDKRQRDCDNRIKPVLDALRDARIIADDNQHHVRKVSAEWAGEGVECCVILTPAVEEVA